jgi:hypothetical protein
MDQDSGEFIRIAKKVSAVILDVIEFLSRFLYEGEEDSEVSMRVNAFLANFDAKLLAEVSYHCEEYPRALVYCEKFMSKLSDEARKEFWVFLVHIYAKLGDGDSINGEKQLK